MSVELHFILIFLVLICLFLEIFDSPIPKDDEDDL
jgi:hypothetical protein